MKKILLIALTAVMMFIVTGCQVQQNEKKLSSNSDSESTQSEATKLSNNQSKNSQSNHKYDSFFPYHEPYGKGIGVMPGRVVWDYEPNSVLWDGNDYWWREKNYDETIIKKMVSQSIASLGGKDTTKESWNALFSAHNTTRGKNGAGYKPGEKITIKANMNGSGTFDDDRSSNTRMSYINPVLLKTLLTSLVEEAGVFPSDITVYDVSRTFPDYMVKMCTDGILNGVKFRDRDITGKNNCVADLSAPIKWSSHISGDQNYLPTCVTEADYLINLANLKGHSLNGVTLTAKNHFGTLMNSDRMAPPSAAGVHSNVTATESGVYSVLVDLMSNYQLGEKTMLYMLDGFIVSPQNEGSPITAENARWQQAPFNDRWTASLFVSQDPVAIDSVGTDFLSNEPTILKNNSRIRNNPHVENYLHEAALVSNPPSGTIYLNGNDKKVTNLGVHEHWNNSIDKQYSRNLGKDEGIELVRIGSE